MMWMRFSRVYLFNFLVVVRYAGRLLVKESGKLLEILPKLKELVGFSPDEEIDLFEVNQFSSSLAIFFSFNS